MREKLVLRILDPQISELTEVEWVLFDQKGQHKDSRHTSLSDLRGELGDSLNDMDVLAIFPGELILLTETFIPSNQMRHIKKALPYMVEELVVEEIEKLHLALAPGSSDGGTISIAAVRHERLINWLDQLHSCDIHPRHCTSEILCIPFGANQNHIQVLVEGGRVFVRSGIAKGWVVTADELDGFLALLTQELEQLTDADIVVAYYHEQVEDKPTAESIILAIKNSVPELETKLIAYQEPATEIFATTLVHHEEETINLLQGGYKVSSNSKQAGGGWKYLYALMPTLLLAFLVLTLGFGQYFENRSEELKRSNEAFYRQIFPNARRIISLRRQLENNLRSGGSSANSFFPVLSQLVNGVEQHTGKGSSFGALQSMRYNPSQGSLKIEAQMDSMEALTKFKAELDSVSGSVSLISAVEQGDGVLGRLELRGP